MTDAIPLSEQHAPKPRAIEAFTILAPKIQQALLKSRRDWDKHETRMYESVANVSDADLGDFSGQDLVAVRTATTAYGTLIFGKLRLKKAGNDAYLHVRIHDPPDEGQSNKDVMFHSIHTLEGGKTADDGRPTWFKAIMTKDDPIEFFHE